VARILELCILHIAMAEMTSKGTPHKVVINEVLIVCLSIYLFFVYFDFTHVSPACFLISIFFEF
jgi:hypothetical protein